MSSLPKPTLAVLQFGGTWLPKRLAAPRYTGLAAVFCDLVCGGLAPSRRLYGFGKEAGAIPRADVAVSHQGCKMLGNAILCASMCHRWVHSAATSVPVMDPARSGSPSAYDLSVTERQQGTFGALVLARRADISRIAASHGAQNVRVFGSVRRGEETGSSDLDLLVDMSEGRSLFDLVALGDELEESLGVDVDVVTEGSISPYLRDRILSEAVAL